MTKCWADIMHFTSQKQHKSYSHIHTNKPSNATDIYIDYLYQYQHITIWQCNINRGGAGYVSACHSTFNVLFNV